MDSHYCLQSQSSIPSMSREKTMTYNIVFIVFLFDNYRGIIKHILVLKGYCKDKEQYIVKTYYRKVQNQSGSLIASSVEFEEEGRMMHEA